MKQQSLYVRLFYILLLAVSLGSRPIFSIGTDTDIKVARTGTSSTITDETSLTEVRNTGMRGREVPALYIQ